LDKAKAGRGIGLEAFHELLERKIWMMERDEAEQRAA